MAVDHASADFARDVAVTVVGGLVLMALGAIGALLRHTRGRLARHGIEIRHTQEKSGIAPFFPEYPADKL